MRLQRQFSGQIITLDTQNPIGGGGEAVYILCYKIPP